MGTSSRRKIALFPGLLLWFALLVTLLGCGRSVSVESETAKVTLPYAGVLTYHNDNSRTGQNLSETILTPANVDSQHFGKLQSYPLDGVVYAQPLYVADVTIPGLGSRNLVYVATEHDSVYAFDADGRSSDPLWQRSFINPAAAITPVPSSSLPFGGIAPEGGITGTPVIDPVTGTLYVVSFTSENGSFVYRLHALDIITGAEKVKGGLVIQASVPGTGDDNDGQGSVIFNPSQHLQRPGLLLSNGVVYVAFGSFWDIDPYHGWLMGYDAQTLQQVSVFNVTPNGNQGSIWMSGGGPAADSDGNIFLATANGTFDADSAGLNFAQSVLKLGPVAGGLSVLDYFTPPNWAYLDQEDLDLDVGSGGVMLVPDQMNPPTHLLIGGDKSATVYLINRDNMGHVASHIVQFLDVGGGVLCTPAYWQNRVYVQPVYDVLRAYNLHNGLLSASSISKESSSYGGATPVVSANGSSNGIVWVVHTDIFTSGEGAVLRAYDAADVSKELYDSTQAGARDVPGPTQGTHFTVPTVFNGRVYLATGQELDVYGPLGP